MAKRSCDFCVSRKMKCDGGQPCRKCVDANPPFTCTYLRPVLKRGPKGSRLRRRVEENWGRRGEAPKRACQVSHLVPDADDAPRDDFNVARSQARMQVLPPSIFITIFEAYHSRMYPVWPVVDVIRLLARLEDDGGNDEQDTEAYMLATALGAATMAQLNLIPIDDASCVIDSTYLERECQLIRSTFNYRQHASVEGVLASFFLHVYHAKIDNRWAAMMFLQEAISLARLLRLDDLQLEQRQSEKDTADKDGTRTSLLYLLLWISERGYAIQHGLRISVQETVKIPITFSNNLDTYGKGLTELGGLFVSFDGFVQHMSTNRTDSSQISSEKELLLGVHRALTENLARPIHYNSVQRADFNVTKQWMQTLLWQQAMSRGLLSSVSETELTSFLFPSRIAQSLLGAMTTACEDDLLPLGRDQLFKFFEITNTLADVVLCHLSLDSQHPSSTQWTTHSNEISYRAPQEQGRRQYGPTDFLHGLFQTMSPFLDHDKRINTLLRQKVAEALLRAPSRVLPKGIKEVYAGIECGLEDEPKEAAQSTHRRKSREAEYSPQTWSP